MIDIAPYLPGIFAAYAILFVGASSPGPSVAMLIGIATSQGRAPALSATAGIATGSLTINVLTMLGVGLLLSQAAWAMSAMRAIGAAYLLYLAYGAFRKAVNPPSFQLVAGPEHSALRHFMTGYLLQVTNPKAIAFWLAIASVGAVEGAGFAIILIFITGAFAISFLCHGAWAMALSAAPVRRAYGAGRRWIESFLGVFFVIAAWKLAINKN